MKYLLFGFIYLSSFSIFANENISGVYVGHLSNGEQCTVNFGLENGTISISDNNRHFTFSMTPENWNRLVESGENPIYIEETDNSPITGKLKLYFNDTGVIDSAKMKIYFTYLPQVLYKTCYELKRVE